MTPFFEKGRTTSAPRLVTCLFGEVNEAGKFVQRSTHAKAARGTFVRWCAAHEVTSVAGLALRCGSYARRGALD